MRRDLRFDCSFTRKNNRGCELREEAQSVLSRHRCSKQENTCVHDTIWYGVSKQKTNHSHLPVCVGFRSPHVGSSSVTVLCYVLLTQSRYISLYILNLSSVFPSFFERFQAFRLQASGMGLFYIRVNVKALVTGSITKWSPNSTSWHDQDPADGHLQDSGSRYGPKQEHTELL